MLTMEELRLIDGYFILLSSNAFCVTIRSKCTGHEWRIIVQESACFCSFEIFYNKEREAIIQLAAEKAFKTGDENFPAIPLMFLTGLRIDECLALCFSDFDMDSHSLYVHASLAVVENQRPDGSWVSNCFIGMVLIYFFSGSRKNVAVIVELSRPNYLNSSCLIFFIW